MVWGHIIHEGPAHIVELLRSIHMEHDVGLLDEFLNYREFVERSLHYLQDSASIHTTLIVSEWARNMGVSIITLPLKSPNLNIMENIWSHIKAVFGQCLTELRTEMTQSMRLTLTFSGWGVFIQKTILFLQIKQ